MLILRVTGWGAFMGMNVFVRVLVLQNAAKSKIDISHLQKKSFFFHGFYEQKVIIFIGNKNKTIDYNGL